MAGKFGPIKNYKELFGYSDVEWQYIWSTMKESGAWDVPSIKDSYGNVKKGNFAPEILIKYIAHDLKCHIIIFDLLLGVTQFCSGNDLQKNNIAFQSPIVLYTTGNHFQSVLPYDADCFIELALVVSLFH